jgi:hypothetical protein
MSTIDQNIWQKIHEHMRDNYGENELWNKVIMPYLNKFTSAVVSTREKVECIDELINHLDCFYLDSQRYGLIPDEFRLFLESSGEASLILGYRLTESVHSLDKIMQLREILLNYNSQPSQKYEESDLTELIKTIDLIINSSS